MTLRRLHRILIAGAVLVVLLVGLHLTLRAGRSAPPGSPDVEHDAALSLRLQQEIDRARLAPRFAPAPIPAAVLQMPLVVPVPARNAGASSDIELRGGLRTAGRARAQAHRVSLRPLPSQEKTR